MVAFLPELEAEARGRQGEHLRKAERDEQGRAKSAPTGADLEIPPEKQTSSADRATALAAAKTGASAHPGSCVQLGHVVVEIRRSEKRSKALQECLEGSSTPGTELDEAASTPIGCAHSNKRPRVIGVTGGMASEGLTPTRLAGYPPIQPLDVSSDVRRQRRKH